MTPWYTEMVVVPKQYECVNLMHLNEIVLRESDSLTKSTKACMVISRISMGMH